MDRGLVRIAPLTVDNHAGYEAVIKLGDRFSDRLGQLPYAAFEDARDDQRILIATDSAAGPVVGYALYRLPRNEVSLTHLCVAPDARGTGVARALVDAISEKHAQRLGIRAKCRDDYELADTWTGLGFAARAKAIGRGRDRAPMTVWWRDHGHPDLFTEYEVPVELRAAIDLNIALDLASSSDRKMRSDLLVADDLAGRLQLVVSSGMLAEINDGERSTRGPLLEAIEPYPTVHAEEARAQDLANRILTEVRNTAPDYPANEQDRRDLLQVAHAAAAGISVFLTWDQRLINRLGHIVEALTGTTLMKPSYVVLHLDELANADAFRLDSLAGSTFTHARAGTRLERELDAFIADSSGERRPQLHRHVHQLIRAGREPRIVHDERDITAALYCAYRNGARWEVPLLRVARHPLADTLARHLLWNLRLQARNEGVGLIDICDPHLPRGVGQAAGFESLTAAGTHWFAPVIDVCGKSDEVAAAAARIHAAAGLPAPPLLRPDLSAHAAATLEHTWWPAKILDSQLPTFVIPIRANYAFELFGYPEGLSTRDTQLSLGREHVYYRSATNSKIIAPARVLWLSTGAGTGSGHIFAASTLDSRVVDSPEQLHETLSYYGTFDLAAVTAAARGSDVAEALRLSDTELFRTPISRRRYRQIRENLGTGPKDFMGPQRIPAELFAALYALATQ